MKRKKRTESDARKKVDTEIDDATIVMVKAATLVTPKTAEFTTVNDVIINVANLVVAVVVIDEKITETFQAKKETKRNEN